MFKEKYITDSVLRELEIANRCKTLANVIRSTDKLEALRLTKLSEYHFKQAKHLYVNAARQINASKLVFVKVDNNKIVPLIKNGRSRSRSTSMRTAARKKIKTRLAELQQDNRSWKKFFRLDDDEDDLN